jgi:hypothetical protein
MPTNTGEAREIKDRAHANESEVIRKSKTLARKVRAELKKEQTEPAAQARANPKSNR